MKTIVIVLMIALFAAPAAADWTLTVTEARSSGGVDGFVVQSAEPGYPTEELFIAADGGMMRVYETRELGEPWDPMAEEVFLVPATTITAGMTWNFLPDETSAYQAEAIQMESVSTPAGTFDAWLVDITEVGGSGYFTSSMWWVDGVGLLGESEFEGGWLTWESKLASYTANGSGFLPLAIGNSWTFQSAEVDTEAGSIGAIKARFGN